MGFGFTMGLGFIMGFEACVWINGLQLVNCQKNRQLSVCHSHLALTLDVQLLLCLYLARGIVTALTGALLFAPVHSMTL